MNYVTVIQISADKFDVFKFSNVTPAQLRVGVSSKGVLIACRESDKHNDKFCFNLAQQFNDKSITVVEF